MNWRKPASLIGKFLTDFASSRATRAAAGVVVERFGPHRILSKIGTVMVLVGLLVVALSWFFLTSWGFWLATTGGVICIAVGFALRGVNNLLVNLLVRCINSISRRLYNFADRRWRRGKPASEAGSAPPSAGTEVTGCGCDAAPVPSSDSGAATVSEKSAAKTAAGSPPNAGTAVDSAKPAQ